MLSNKPLDKLVFLALKTTSQYESYDLMPPNFKDLFYKRYKREVDERSDQQYYIKATSPGGVDDRYESIGLLRAFEEIYNEKAALTPEFGKIICLSVGAIDLKIPDKPAFRTLTISNAVEDVLLNEIVAKNPMTFGLTAIGTLSKDIVGHGIKGFHFPFLAKRMILNGINLPAILDTSNEKPWNLTYLIDTMEQWSFGSWGDKTSLDLLAASFGIPKTPEQISGKDVKDVYYKEKDMAKIEKYCADDLWTLANVYLKMKNIKINLTK